MDKQVSANDDINPTRCCCVPSVKCMHQFECDRWGKIRKESQKKKNSLFKTIYGIKGFHDRRFISTAKYYRNDSSCFPEQIISSLVKLRVKSACRQLMSRRERTYTEADYWLALRWEDSTTSLYLRDDTFIVLVSMPKSFDTVHETVRFAVGTTLILCVILPLTKGLSSCWMRREMARQERTCLISLRIQIKFISGNVKGVFCTARGRCWIDVWLGKWPTVRVSGITVSQDNFKQTINT